jgi:hypothetical protein
METQNARNVEARRFAVIHGVKNPARDEKLNRN